MGFLDWNTRNASTAPRVDKGAASRNYQYQQSRSAAQATTQAATDRVAARDKIVDAQKYENLQASQKRNAAAAVAQTKLAAEKNDAAKARADFAANDPRRTDIGRTVVTKAQLGSQQFPLAPNYATRSPEVKIASQQIDDGTDTGPLQGSKMEILGKNVLNDYVNYTYNFTLSGLASDSLKNPSVLQFEADSKAYTVLKSSGKGNDYTMQSSRDDNDQSNKFINGFNEKSPGRFDMYIDNLEIDTLLSFSGKSGPTLPLAFRFEVFEPYSINGFLEALQAAALGGGYLNYASASFLLKMNFVGYNEDDTFEESIPNSTRYFGIKITKIQLEVTAKGSKYICVGLPFNEYAFSDEINKLHQSVQFEGNTVEDILWKFLGQVYAQRSQANIKAHTENGRNAAGKDEYDATFVDANSDFKALRESKVISANLKESKIFTFVNNQGSGNKNGYGNAGSNQAAPATQTSRVISFSENSNITDCIAAVITESEWAKNLLKNLKGKYDPVTGLVDYFLVRVEVTNKDTFDLISNRPYQKFNYVITPYKIHYTMIPGYQQEKFVYDTTMKKHFLLRQYNYIYTGKNVDILDFKINFNNSLYATMPNAMGVSGLKSLSNVDRPSDTSYKAHDGSPEQRKKVEDSRRKDVPTAGNVVDGKLNSNHYTVLAYGSLSAGAPSDDPYYMQAKAMYEAVVKRAYNMTEVELSILGDPIFLVMGGVSNFNPKSTNGVVTENGSLNSNFGTPYIEVTFRNPIDINPSGFLEFQDTDPESGRLAFSGVFMIKKVISKFSNGLFTQRLQLARMPQSDKTEIDPTSTLLNQPNSPGAEPEANAPPVTTGVDSIGPRNQAYTSSLTKKSGVAANLNRESLTSSQAFERMTTRQ
jgi:hypothetical protein